MWERLERREINQRASTAATTTMSRRPRPGRPGLPYARPGYLCTKTHDHTSVLKLVEEKWNLPPLTRGGPPRSPRSTRWTSTPLPPSALPRTCRSRC
jgi:hypothetical protein